MHGAVNERVGQAAELLRRQGADVRRVDGPQLQRVKDGRGLGNAAGVPDLDHLVQGEDLLLAFRGPAQQQQIVQHRLGQIAFGHQVLVAGIAVALGQLVLGVLHDRRAVDVDGLLPAESLIQQVVFGGGGEVLAAADHVGNAHQVIVHHVGKVVGGHAVGLDQDLVVQFADVHLNVAVDHIVKARHAALGDLLADDIGFACRQLGRHFLFAQVAAVAVVVGHLAGGALCLVQLVQPLLGAEAVIGLAFLYQLLGILLEHAHAFALYVGAHGTADVRAFVPGQAGGAQGAVDDIGGAFHQTALVGVLNAQDKGAAIVAGLQIGVQRGAQVAYVHIAGGRRRKAGAYVGCHKQNPFVLCTVFLSKV